MSNEIFLWQVFRDVLLSIRHNSEGWPPLSRLSKAHFLRIVRLRAFLKKAGPRCMDIISSTSGQPARVSRKAISLQATYLVAGE
jgi:hypothetical protein